VPVADDLEVSRRTLIEIGELELIATQGPGTPVV
jgi:hypothetical protein